MEERWRHLLRPKSCNYCQRQFATALTPLDKIRSCKTCHRNIVALPEDDNDRGGTVIKTNQLNLLPYNAHAKELLEIKETELLEEKELLETETTKELEKNDLEDKDKQKRSNLTAQREAEKLKKVVSDDAVPIEISSLPNDYSQYTWKTPAGVAAQQELESGIRNSSFGSYLLGSFIQRILEMGVAIGNLPHSFGNYQPPTSIQAVTYTQKSPPSAKTTHRAGMFSNEVEMAADELKAEIQRSLKRS